nr:hypothetical protein 22 [Candidatus Hydrogenedentota bacterium]
MKLYGKHTEDVANRIIQAFKNPEKLPPALAQVFIHRKDDKPCSLWSWHNQLLVALSGTSDARGFRQWQEVNRNVKKGSKAIHILAPCMKKITVDDDDGEEKERTIIYGFRSVPVFTVEDTEGDPIPTNDDHYENWVEQLPLIEVARAWNINVGTYTHKGAAPLGFYRYAQTGDKAIMLGTENLSTFTHELVHAADHRLHSLQGTKAHREIVAEFGGAVLLECLGRRNDADLGGAYEYIQRYSQEENKSEVQSCMYLLRRICDCVDLILTTAETMTAQSVPA